MDEVKRQIIQTATEQFKRYGIKSVSIDDLSRQIGISKKTFYVYFTGKEDLVGAVLASMNEHIRIEADKYMSGKSAAECIHGLTLMHDKVKDVLKIPTFAYDLKKYYHTLYLSYVREVRDNTQKLLTRHLQQGIDEGIYRQDLDVDMCALMYTMLQQSFMRDIQTPDNINPKRFMRFAVESFFRSIVSEEGRQQLAQRYEYAL